ncbi:hypothetical protein VTN77DRAFT_6517 [Rasamsonia byssochlamydoides]|uniref:uncharacterized protein n=1 Tax=Rasamsonia byssochlamydoides TaxID=89139 RepID=UPI0037442879
MCKVLQAARRFGNIRLRLLIEDHEGNGAQLWQQRSRPRELSFVESLPAVSLKSLLSNGVKLSLVTKRQLAVIFANSLLQFSERPWLANRWNKGHIAFFYESANSPILTKPYLSTQFDGDQADFDWPDINQFHTCPTILSLGILLIEIHTGSSIESFRTSRDLTGGVEVNANTDWTTADRVIKSLDDCSAGYRAAVQACLDTPWVSAGQRVSLEDPETREGFLWKHMLPVHTTINIVIILKTSISYSLEYEGWKVTQVKLRGQQIDLGEVKNHVRQVLGGDR